MSVDDPEEEEEVINAVPSHTRAQILPVRTQFKIAIAHAFLRFRKAKRLFRKSDLNGSPRHELKLVANHKQTLGLILGHGSAFIHSTDVRTLYQLRLRSISTFKALGSFFRRIMRKIDDGRLDPELYMTASHFHGVDYHLTHVV